MKVYLKESLFLSFPGILFNHENEKALRQGITIFHIVLVTWVSIEAEMMNKSYFPKTEMNVR